MIDLSTIPTSDLMEELKARQAALLRDLLAMNEVMRGRAMSCKDRADALASSAGILWEIIPARIFTEGRQGSVATARQAIMYVLRQRYQHTFQEIGDVLGGRDHVTVMHGCNAIAARMPNEPDLANRVAILLESSH